MQDRKYDAFRNELNILLDTAKKTFVSTGNVSGLLNVAEIEDILNDNLSTISKKWDKLFLKANNMPGYFSFWSKNRQLTIGLKLLLNSYKKEILLEDEVNFLQLQIEQLKDENNLLKSRVDNLQKDQSEENIRLEEENIQLKNKLDVFSSNYDALINAHEQLLKENNILKLEIQTLQENCTKHEENFLKIKEQIIEQKNCYEAKIEEQNVKIEQIQLETEAKFAAILKMVDQQNKDKSASEDRKLNKSENPLHLKEIVSSKFAQKEQKNISQSNKRSLWTLTDHANSSTDRTAYGNDVLHDETGVYLRSFLKK